jgi:pSer/pThr/pTyr-binding forkhead associated (FHA) protein
VCSAGHPNPPHEARCRRCAAPLATEAVVIDRPSLGRLQLSTGEEIDLDRPLLIGRNPKLEGRLMSELPRTVKLEHLQGLSRTHAMISPEGWQVFVVDLGSVNHTTVTLPGRPPRQLHADEPVPIVHGTTIDFGGEVTATYDADAGAT